MVFDHFRNHPDRSIGIIAFGEVQQSMIESVITKRRQDDLTYEDFFSMEREEPLFIKNLETVQGDERDTIIFSIGYAKDANGIFRMNFGPLSRNGGERRLNVAVTRARYQLKLVGSILPTDINVDKISGNGPKLLRDYIDFTIRGADALLTETKEQDRYGSTASGAFGQICACNRMRWRILSFCKNCKRTGQTPADNS